MSSYTPCSVYRNIVCYHIHVTVIHSYWLWIVFIYEQRWFINYRKISYSKTQRIMFTLYATLFHAIVCKRDLEPCLYKSNPDGRNTRTTYSIATLDGFGLKTKMEPRINCSALGRYFQMYFLELFIVSIKCNFLLMFQITTNPYCSRKGLHRTVGNASMMAHFNNIYPV